MIMKKVVKQQVNSRLVDARFWTRIMKEHSLFIDLGLPCDQTALKAEAQRFFQRFQALETRVNRAATLGPVLLRDLINAITDLIEFKRRILRMMVQCQIQGGNATPLLIDHITREAVHFRNLLLTNPPANPIKDVLEREVFWLRIMKEHIEFIIQLLDPSERELLVQAHAFRRTFSRLLETARDLQSMEESNPRTFNRVARFTNVVAASTTRLRNFKAAAHELDLICQLLGIIPSPLLLDHVRREADKFLQEINDLKGRL
jgi:hypothetical protein